MGAGILPDGTVLRDHGDAWRNPWEEGTRVFLPSVGVTLERAHRNEFVARASLLAATGQLNAQAILDGRCCGADTSERPTMSALGRPRMTEVGKAVLDPATAPRPQMSSLGQTRDRTPADAAAPAGSSGRPASSALGRKLN